MLKLIKKIIIIFLFLSVCSCVYGNNECTTINFICKDKIFDSMTLEEFKILLKAAKAYEAIDYCEKHQLLKVILEDDPWNIIIGKTYSTYINIVWNDKKGQVLKTLRLKAEFNIPEEKGMVKWRIIYRDVAEIATPILIITNLICIIIIIL